MSGTATRLITLIMLLQREPNQSAAQLAKTLGVSTRTIQRYISMLDEMGIPVYAEYGPYGGYALAHGYKMPPLVLTPEEAVALHLGAGLLENVWGPVYQEAAQGALAKLDNVLPEEQQREVAWARQTLLAMGMRWVDSSPFALHLKRLWNAARDGRRVRILYQGAGQKEPSQREVDPYRLIHAWGWQYVMGYCHLRQAIRSFRVDRIADLTVLDETFEIPVDFDLQAYLSTEPFFNPQVRVRLYFPPESALLAQDNRAMWETSETQPDGSVLVSYASIDLERAASIALRCGHQATVLEPPELRELLRERARAIAALYEPPSPDAKPSTNP